MVTGLPHTIGGTTMSSIIYVGMDVHTTNYALCCYSIEHDMEFASINVEPDYRSILNYLKQVEENYGDECEFICGYEAGCLGYSLYNELTFMGVKCLILAPTTMATQKGKRIKNDFRDAKEIAKCIAYNQSSYVYVPTEEDNAVKEYIRMRVDVKNMFKKNKQQVIAFCTRNGKIWSEGSKWTQKYLNWLKNLDFGNEILNETLGEYLALYYQLSDKIELFDKRISELADTEPYKDKVDKLSCFIGINDYTALAVIVEISDFNRFKSADYFASYLGLVPGEDSSGKTIRRTGITKAGNTHLRKLLIESAQCYSRGAVGKKSKALIARQNGNTPQVIAYADRAIERLKRKYYRLMNNNHKHNVAVTAVARELACFIWGMMTDNIA
jgi:transposase